MSRFLLHITATVLLAILLSACELISVEGDKEERSVEPEYASGEVLISLEHGDKMEETKARIEELGLEWKDYFDNLGVALIGVPAGQEVYWVKELEEEPLIRYAELNRKVELR